MSGGSYDYAYRHFEEFADRLEGRSPERMAFVKLVRLVAVAAHAIEWVDSGDSSPPADSKAIRAALRFCGKDSAKTIKAAAFDELATWFERRRP